MILLSLPFVLCGCAAPPEPAAVAALPRFSAQAFFAGRTEGRATLKKALSAGESVHVLGNGHVEPDGTLVLDQIVEEQGKRPKQRQWRIREVSPGRYAGSLSDASGPIAGDVSGNRLHLRFTMKGGLAAEQWLYLAADGRSAHNVMTVRKFGITLAVLDETIRKIG